MTTEGEIADKFWKAIKGDRTVMLSLADVEEGHSQPMTAQFDDDDATDDTRGGPIWFFTSKDTNFARTLGQGRRAVAHFASKGHELFASLHGELAPDNDPATIERLWNPFVAAWFEGGKDDAKLLLLRLEPQRAQIWLNENSLLTGVKLLLGRDPKRDYQNKVAEVSLHGSR